MNGKNEGRNRIFVDGEKNRRAKWISVALRSTNEIPSSTASPSIWEKAGACEASNASLRYTIPGITTRTGGGEARQRPDLHRRGVRPEQQPTGRLALGGRRVKVKRVVHVHRRMIGREIEREEVVPLGLDLGAQRHGEADLPEDADDLVHHAGDGMLRAEPPRAGRHREVDARLLPLFRSVPALRAARRTPPRTAA